MIVLESTPDDTENAILDGIFALISPVITFTDGRCVATTRWIPAARQAAPDGRLLLLHLPALPSSDLQAHLR